MFRFRHRVILIISFPIQDVIVWRGHEQPGRPAAPQAARRAQQEPRRGILRRPHRRPGHLQMGGEIPLKRSLTIKQMFPICSSLVIKEVQSDTSHCLKPHVDFKTKAGLLF